MDWRSFITSDLISDVIPEEYAAYRMPAQESLIFFLKGLPEARRIEILAQQASLRPAAAAPERIALLARGCPTLHKLGQTLARDRRLSPELRRHLQPLESLPPSFSMQSVREIVSRELGPPESLGIRMLPAIAEASVAVVVPFRSRATPRDNVRDGVFKILKPGIEERLGQELEMLERTGSFLDGKIAEFGIPRIQYREVFEQIRNKLLRELRLDLEQRNLEAARTVYSGSPKILIPAVFRHYCTKRVTAMERITGRKITEASAGGKGERERLVELVIHELIVRPVLSHDGLFHGDPHPGNLFLTDEGRLAILDWSLTGALSEAEHRALLSVILGALTLNPDRIETELVGLSASRAIDKNPLRRVIHAGLQMVREGSVPGLAWATRLLDRSVAAAGLRLGPDLLLFRRAIHILNGVVADLGGSARTIDGVLIREFAGAFMLELPFRWFAPFGSREFSTRLSNADLAELMLTLPWAAARFWFPA